jgi:hypothetical protein
MFAPITEMVPPGAVQKMASLIDASAPTASITASAPRPPVRSWTIAGVEPFDASIGSAPSFSAVANRSGTMSTA